MVDCLRPFLKIACLQLTYSGVQGMDRQVGIFFSSVQGVGTSVQGVGMKTRIFKLGTSLDVN